MNLKDEYTILIVDDSLSDRGMYRRYLEENKSFEYQILEAESLENGLKLWKQQTPDVMLVNLDINWPTGSGLELLDAIKKTDSRQKLPIIVISGQGNERIAVQAMQRGASDYLIKEDITAPYLCLCVENTLERQRVWQELEASEKRFTHLADTAPVGIFRTDAQGNCLYVNQRWSQIAGLSYEKALGQGWSQALYIEDREAIAAEWYASTEECRPFKMEYRFQRPDGTITWVFGESSAERDNQGKIIGYLGTITDISDRKWAELTLQRLISGTASVTGENFFPTLVQTLAEALNVSYAVVTELVADQLHTLGFWSNGALQPAISYHAAHTPCGVALRKGEYYCQSRIQAVFPQDLDLVTMQAESYLGVALKDHQGNAIGNLCILDTQPFTEKQRIEAIAILQVFAARAAAELLRQQADKALYQLNQELEAKIEERTAALQASEAFNRSILETIPDLLLHLKRDGTCLNYIEPKVNKERFLPISKHISEILPPDDLEKTLQSIEQAIATQELQVDEHQLLKNGCLTDEEIRVLALNDQEVLVIVRDISDRKRSEEALKISEERFRNAFDTTAVGMALVSSEGQFIKVNPSLCHFWGYSEAELLEMTFQDITYPDDLASDLELLQQLLAGEINHYNLEKRYFTKNGQLVWGYLSVSLVTDTNNQPLYFVSQVQDITPRKQAEKELKNANIELERLLKLREETLTFREDMSNMIVHDLRNPLTAMMLSAEVLLKCSDHADNRSIVTKQANRMLQAGKHITEMIDSLLYMAKLESGKIILNPTLTDLHQFGLSILAEFQLIKKSQNIELTSQLPAPGTHILIDSIILRRIIENLLSNALKFSPPQSQIHLSIKHLPADHLRIQVADNGPGIDPDTYDKIFGKFEIGQIQQDVSQIGLGLAFCKMAVEAHGGTIAIAPNQPQGSIFTVEI